MPPRTDLVLSLLLHVAAGAAWWLHTTTATHSAPAAVELTALPSTPLLVAIDPPVDPARPLVEPDPGMEAEPEPQEPSTEAAPIDYLAEAADSAQMSPPEPEATAADSAPLTPGPSPSSLLPPKTPPTDLLQATLAADGTVRAPAYTVVGLDDRLLRELLAAGSGCLLVTVGGERWIATGTWPEAMTLTPLATSPWRTRIAERMLPLPPRFATALAPALTRELGPLALSGSHAPTLRLALTHAADTQLLAAQQAAVQSAGGSWADCAVTAGTLTIDGGTLRFQTTHITRRP